MKIIKPYRVKSYNSVRLYYVFAYYCLQNEGFDTSSVRLCLPPSPQGEGLEASGVAAFAAKLLGGAAFIEAREDIFCSFGV